MAVDHGNPGASSQYYGTGQSDAFVRARTEMDQLKGAYNTGRIEGNADGFVEGVDQMGQEIIDNSGLFHARKHGVANTRP